MVGITASLHALPAIHKIGEYRSHFETLRQLAILLFDSQYVFQCFRDNMGL